MEECEYMDKSLHDLVNVIHFTENVSVKIHGVLNEADIYRTLTEEFARSKRYSVSIVLMTDDRSKLRIAGTSIPPQQLMMGEKVSGLRLKDYKIDLNKSSVYAQVVREGKTIQVNSRDMMCELFSRPLVYLLSKVIDFKNEKSIVTPLKLRDKIIGALTISSTDLAEYFIPTVKNLAQHISNALELSRHRHALEESERKLRTVIDTSSDAIVWVDTTGKITLVNEKVFEITGFSKKELIGKNFMDVEVLTEESKEKIMEAFMKRLNTVNTPPYEVEIVTKDGEIIPFEISASAIFDKDRIFGVQAIFRDLRERKRMEEKLRHYSEHLEDLVEKRTEELMESEKRYSVLVEEASDGVVILQDEKIVFLNKRILEIAGYSRDEVIGIPVEKIVKMVDKKYRQMIKERHWQRLQGEEVPARSELELITKTGERVPVETSSAIIYYRGHPAVLTIVRDIRERKRMEEQRLRLERMAAVGEVATMVGHDLRNPLQSIEIATYYLNNELPRLFPSTPIPQETMKMLKVINESVNYADRIIRDLHDFSATRRPTFKKTRINAIIKETLSQVETPENVKIITRLGRLPEVNADKYMIKRVFMNLILNGIQAMEKGGTLKVSTKKTKGSVEIGFKDAGVGIPKEDTKRIFTPFFTKKAKGMGVGLAICKRFIDNHDGRIEVESEEGKGSTFTVKLPV